MRHIGDSSEIKAELFPSGFISEIMELIGVAWQRISPAQKIWKEEDITALLKQAAADLYYQMEKNWFVALEEPINDPNSGKVTGRTDLRFYPPNHERQTLFFTVECKRLNVSRPSGFKTLAPDYISDGIMRFVEGKYSSNVQEGGMIGYVMDGKIQHAVGSVENEIRTQESRVGLHLPISVSETSSFPKNGLDTLHQRAGSLSKFRICHGFVRARWLAKSKLEKGTPTS